MNLVRKKEKEEGQKHGQKGLIVTERLSRLAHLALCSRAKGVDNPRT